MAASLPFLRLIFKEFSKKSQNAAESKGKGAIKGKYVNLDDEKWMEESVLSSNGTKRGKLVMQDGKATVSFQ